MIPILEDMFERLDDLTQMAKTSIKDLPDAALDWSPGEGMNSLGVLASHTSGSIRYLIGDMAGGQTVKRERDHEFVITGLSVTKATALLDEALEYSKEILETFSYEDLEMMRYSERHKREFRVGWSLSHALEHAALHVGHMEITRQVWDQREG